MHEKPSNLPPWRPARHLERTGEGAYLVDCSVATCKDPTHRGESIEASARYLDSERSGDGARDAKACEECGGTVTRGSGHGVIDTKVWCTDCITVGKMPGVSGIHY